MSILHYFERSSPDTAIVREMILDGSDPDETDQRGRTPLHVATVHGWIHNIRSLVKLGAKLDIKDNDGCTPLHLASCRTFGYSNQNKIVILLLSLGSDINARSKCGYTPLNYAILHGTTEMISDIMENGSKIGSVRDLSRASVENRKFFLDKMWKEKCPTIFYQIGRFFQQKGCGIIVGTKIAFYTVSV